LKLVGECTLSDGKRAKTVFQLLAERYLQPDYAPERIAERIGVPAATIRRIAHEIAEAAFAQAIELPVAWTDWAGRRHETMIGRPVSFHAMRGISAHANGFQTCRAIHLLQMLIGAIDCPGAFRYKPPFPRPCPPGPKPAGKTVAPATPLGGMPLGFTSGPEDLLVDAAGEPTRIDKAYSWEYPVAAHGLMHMALHNAWAGDPYPIEVFFSYMANVGWNSSMNIPETLKYLTDTRPDGSYRIPKFIYSDAYWSETVAYADLVLPDTTYLERWDCISILDRPICTAEGPADAIRQPVVAPDRDVRPFQDVLIELGVRLKLPAFSNADGTPKFPGGYPDYIVNHERSPGIGPLAGWRGEDGASHGKGAPNPDQLKRYIENGAFWQEELPADQRYYKHANRGYLDFAHRMGWIPNAEPIVLQLYSEPLRRFQLAAEGHGPVQPPDRHRARLKAHCDPLPFWFAPFGFEHDEARGFALHAITQRPMHMYHSWGSQNAWLRQITTRNDIHIHPDTARAAGIAEGDWCWIHSPLGKVKARARLMAGVNPQTVWTWNAIGKRAGAWGLSPDAPEAREGFLLNHLIGEFVDLGNDGRVANSDPVTGQAAWFDLRVRIEKCAQAEAGATEPQFGTLPGAPLAEARAVLRYGAAIRDRAAGQPAADRHREWIGNRSGYQSAGVLAASRTET
jgi:anaerobic selenocysteine-containing dehydrogenase